ncbi:MAG: hypothetical protein HAW60_01235 [Bdellovibrionales bacterium]|nr:hypothetical protein [Bdellovibrionales bacterium]
MRLFYFLLISFISINAHSKIPNMRVQFGSGLNKECSFVDNEQVVASLEASLKVLNQIEEQREECKSVHSNSKAFLDTYLGYMRNREESLQQAVVEESVIKSEIERLTLDGSYDNQYDSSLLEVLKTKALNSNKKKRRSNALLQTFQLSSTLLEDLEKNPKCAASVSSHIVAPSIGILGQLSGAFYSGASAFGIPLIAGFAQLVSKFVSYVGSVSENSYVGLENLTKSSNYYLSYKCAFKNIEKIKCSLLEEEHMLGKLHLPNFGKKILKLDKTKRFKTLRDLKRHRYRIFELIEEIDKLFNSPETFDAVTQVVTLQSTFSKLELEPKNPPLKNQFYIDALKKEGFVVINPIGIWSSYDVGQLKWSKWFVRYFLNSSFLGTEVQNACLKSARWSTNFTACKAVSLTQVAEINDFIKEVIVPALINTLKEQKRLNVQIKAFPSLQSLYTLLSEQETYKGDPDYNEYSLSKLFKKFNNYSKFFLQSPARLFSQDILKIIKSLNRLLIARTHTMALFLQEARNAYDSLATISNNGRSGGVLYVSFLDAKFSNYFESITRYYLLQDQKVALNFSKFNVMANLYKKYQSRLVQPSSAGSSNLSLMTDIQSSFLNVFLPSMIEHLKTVKMRYQSSLHKKEKRELLHSCALFLPYLDSKGSDYSHTNTNYNNSSNNVLGYNDGDDNGDYGTQISSNTNNNWEGDSSLGLFCKNLLQKEQGLPFLVRGEQKYSLKPDHRPAFDKSCYYYYYQREVSIKQISQKFEYLNQSIKF